MSTTITIHWFRQDLRLNDNPAFSAAATNGIVIPVYIWDNVNAGVYQMGSASRCWLHYSLMSLNVSLDGHLLVYAGDPENILNELIKKYDVSAVNWNRCYEPWAISRDRKIKHNLATQGITVNSFNGSLLWEPWEVVKKVKVPLNREFRKSNDSSELCEEVITSNLKDNSSYRVFTPFYHNGCLQIEPRLPHERVKHINYICETQSISTNHIEQLQLLPEHNWAKKITSHWEIGEEAAQDKLNTFMAESVLEYQNNRDFPSLNATSKLAPHLHFGELSPNQVWYASRNDADCFRRQIAWREFSYNLLYYNPHMPDTNLQIKFNQFPWKYDDRLFNLWKKGQTGFPLIDAGMRQLWQTGYMHNRVRMLVASFLVKNLLIDWKYGERWFWDCLVDADLANNVAGWQWVAGSGADAAPYYRIFNPTTQGQKFDPSGIYTRHYVPELAKLPDKYLFNPADAPPEVLAAANVELGVNYPLPIIDLKFSRERALTAFNNTKHPHQ